MKKSILSLAVAAGVSTTAMAQMHINHQGTGEALVYPLYTTQNGNDTYIAVVNTTANAKAVKVRMLEAENSVEVLDFNLYLSPWDHFSFAITANSEGGASLVTNDISCTVPQIDGPIPFRDLNYREADVGNNDISRVQIGHIEVIEMGQIDDESAVFDDVLHGSTMDCGALTDRWSVPASDETNPQVGEWLDDASVGFMEDWMGGGLYGYGQVVNVEQGTAFGYDAVAIAGLVETADVLRRGDDEITEVNQSGWAMHYEPGDVRPNFNDDAITQDVMTEAGPVVPADEIRAVAALFQTTDLENDYVTDPDINALTDWVITAPTKQYHTNDLVPVEPFNDLWDGETACEPVALMAWDREEGEITPDEIPGTGPDFSPSPDRDPQEPDNNDMPLCFETNIVQFGDESALGGEDVVVGVPSELLPGVDGWMRIMMDEADLQTDRSEWDNRRAIEGLQGLPVTGFAVIKYTNSSANEAGALANYAVSTAHKSVVISSLVD